MKSKELRELRAKKWEGAKAFLDTRRGENGLLSAEDDAAYTKMEQEIMDLGKEIERQERLEAMDRELAKPISTPIVEKPMTGEHKEKKGRFTEEYATNFWNMMGSKLMNPAIVNALQEGDDSEGGYLVPDEYEHTLIEALEEENIFRSLAKVIRTVHGDKQIPMVVEKGEAQWMAEEAAYTEDDIEFGMTTIGAHKLGTMIKISDELLQDSVFDLPGYIAREFARRIGNAEENAFFTGNGTGKPLGILAATGGAEVGVTSSAASLKADELFDLQHSLRTPYRKNAVWVTNDNTIREIRKMKDGEGRYIWQPGLTSGAPDTILGKPVKTSVYMPTVAAGAKVLAFGDFSWYWVADRQGRSFKRLNELFATTGQVGFLASERVDGKLILPEAIKVLQMKS